MSAGRGLPQRRITTLVGIVAGTMLAVAIGDFYVGGWSNFSGWAMLSLLGLVAFLLWFSRSDVRQNRHWYYLLLALSLLAGILPAVFSRSSQREPDRLPLVELPSPPRIEEGKPWLALRERIHRDVENPENAKPNWETEFPWKPTTDPSVVITTELLEKARIGKSPVLRNHRFLKEIFSNEMRLSPQFEAIYRILKDYDRAENPIAVAKVFNHLWFYHEAANKDPSEPTNLDGSGKGVSVTWGKMANQARETLRNQFSLGRESLALSDWPNRDGLSEGDANQLVERLIDEVDGMDIMASEHSHDKMFVTPSDSEFELEIGDSPLVPWVGWQAEYEKEREAFDRQLQQSIQESDPSLQAIAPHLFLDGITIEGQHVVFPDGEPVTVDNLRQIRVNLVDEAGNPLPLMQGDAGELRLPTPQELETLSQLAGVSATSQ